ncbi:MAG: NADH-quinone oxidoreductase subunit L, partial [bacterium]|nr:NADH-quinone oxidoreductase subunit L [bacterium]
GAGLAWMDFGRSGAPGRGFVESTPLGPAFAAGFWVDAFWRWVSDAVIAALTAGALFVDRKVIDKTVDGVGDGTRKTGVAAAALQSGGVQFYVSVTLGLLAALVLYLGVRS